MRGNNGNGIWWAEGARQAVGSSHSHFAAESAEVTAKLTAGAELQVPFQARMGARLLHLRQI